MNNYTPICYYCHVLMRPTFELALVMFPKDRPTTLWAADVYECPLCYNKVVAGQADEPLIRDNPEMVARYSERNSANLFILKG